MFAILYTTDDAPTAEGDSGDVAVIGGVSPQAQSC